ncbi:MAG: hypothetical protein ACYTGC_07640 [Planctomycetota bacterium]|jgi:hypothetical protein
MRRIPHLVLLGLAGLVATACAPAITYPPEEGVLSSRSAPDEPVPTLMARAIEYAHGEWGGDGEIVINLPAGTPVSTYDKVLKRLGSGRPMEDPDEPAYHVTRVSSQASEAVIDLFYPQPDGSYTFVTLTFQMQLIGGYQHHMTRTWDTGDQPPPPSYPEVIAGTTPED